MTAGLLDLIFWVLIGLFLLLVFVSQLCEEGQWKSVLAVVAIVLFVLGMALGLFSPGIKRDLAIRNVKELLAQKYEVQTEQVVLLDRTLLCATSSRTECRTWIVEYRVGSWWGRAEFDTYALQVIEERKAE